MINKKTFIIFLNTFIITALAVLFVSVIIEFFLLCKVENKVLFEEVSLKKVSNFLNIEQIKQQLEVDTENYILMIKLANLYDNSNEIKKADKLFNEALNVSNKSNFSLYSYSIFCAKRGNILKATTLAEEIVGNNKTTISYKAKIYSELGKYFSENNEALASMMAYKVAYKYAKAMKDLEFLEKIKELYSKSYIKLADERIDDENNVEQAVLDLKNSIKIFKTPEAYYKLALIYMDDDKQKAELYMAKAIKLNPYIVNPYIYNHLLEELITLARAVGDESLCNFYILKQKNLKRILADNYIYKNDILISDVKMSGKNNALNFLNKNEKYILYNLINNSKNELKKINIKTEIIINKNIYSSEDNILKFNRKIMAGEKITDLKIKMPKIKDNNILNSKNPILVKFYAKKSDISPWTLLKIEFVNF